MSILDRLNVKARDAATGTLLIPAIVFGLLGLCPGCGRAPVTPAVPGARAAAVTPPVAGEREDRGPAPEKPGGRDPGLDAELIGAGWTRDAAGSVARLNADWFRELDREAPAEAEHQRDLLRRLGRTPRILDVVARHPEVAGLLVAAVDPDALAESLRDERHYPAVASLYVRHVDPEDATALAAALRRHGELILRLVDRRLEGAEVLFLAPEEEPGAREYGRWLEDYSRAALEGDEEQLEAAVALVLEHGPTLRLRLIEEDAFRRRFREELWPRYARVAPAAGLGPEAFAWEPRVWDLVGIPEGEALLRRWGLLAVDLLFGARGAYPADLHPGLTRTLLEADNAEVGALVRFRDEPLLHRILRRPGLTEATRMALLDRLAVEGSASLPRFDGYSDRILAEELGPPASGPVTWIPLYYTVYEVPRKILDGRPVPLDEVIQALADPILLGLPGGGKVGEEFFRTTLKARARQFAARQIGVQAAEKLPERALAPWIRATVLSRARQLAARGVEVEVTGPVRTLFKASGLGRASFRRLTDLEARLFMRRDARVFVRLDGVGFGRFFERTARAAIEERVEGWMGAGQPGRRSAPPDRSPTSPGPEPDEAWRKNVSAWWLLNAGGIATPAGRPAGEPGDSREP